MPGESSRSVQCFQSDISSTLQIGLTPPSFQTKTVIQISFLINAVSAYKLTTVKCIIGIETGGAMCVCSYSKLIVSNIAQYNHAGGGG